jgi:Lar family restriction alleviation protein
MKPEIECPFCGGKGKAEYSDEDPENVFADRSFFVVCKRCGAHGPSFSTEDFKLGKKQAIKAWDERVQI